MKRTLFLAVAVTIVVAMTSCSGLAAPADGVPSPMEAPLATSAPPSAGAPLVDDGKAASTRSADAESDARKLEFALSPAPVMEKDSSKAMPGIAGPSGAGATSAAAPRATPGASGLKAGFSDDNAQFNYFVDFLQKYGEVPHFEYDISERLTVRVVDSAGKPVSNARVTASAGGKLLASGLTYSDGTWRFYPAALGSKNDKFDIRAEYGRLSARLEAPRDGVRLVELSLQGQRTVPAPVPLDVLFVMDTTGSMGEEIERLKSTIEIIYANLAELKPRPLVRFGLVLYKDRGDEYITEVVPFTKDLDAFQARLEPVEADGGGDGPEDLESALDDAVNKMDWNEGGLRLAFIVTDAEAHLDYNRDYSYIDAANDARARAIKLHTIGTGGLPLEGEYLLRQVAQLTDSKYIFLTYGEGGEAEGGKEGSVSHHSGSNFQTDKLEAIIIRFVREEVANLSDTPLAAGEDYFSAQKIDDETRDQTLDKLFADAIGNLADYSTYHITADTPCAVLPVATSDQGLGATAEYFGERLSMASAGAKRWKPVERKDLQKILAELELQLSGLADEGSAAKVGELLGADVLVASTLYRRADRYELFLRLVRVSTAEVLSVSRAKLELDLGL